MAKNKVMDVKLIKEELFYFLSFTLITFFILEIISPNIVLAYFNLNWLFVAWLIAGIVLLKK